MAFPHELNGLQGSVTCDLCGQPVPLRVLKSRASYYLGYACCGQPLGRETGYFARASEAETALARFQADGTPPANTRDTGYHAP